MRRKLLKNENIIKKWGQLNLTTHRLWIESGDDDNYFLNSVELKEIQGHSIVKYNNRTLLNYAVLSFFMSPLSAILLKLEATSLSLSPQSLTYVIAVTSFSLLVLSIHFFWSFRSSQSLSLNFQTGSKNLYFKLTGEFARISDALEFSNLVDAQIHSLEFKVEEGPTQIESKEPRSFKIS